MNEMTTTTTTIVTAIGATDTIIHDGGGTLDDLNTKAQLAAGLVTVANMSNPLIAGAALTASQFAMATGFAALETDIKAGKSRFDIMADIMTISGDIALFVGATA